MLLFLRRIECRIRKSSHRKYSRSRRKGRTGCCFIQFRRSRIFKNCRLSGYQDTLCTGPLPDLQKDGTPFCTPASANPEYCRQTYEYCWIEGTVDFIFGGADAVFHQCHIHSLASKNPGYITAASTPKNQKQGIVLKAVPSLQNLILETSI